MLWLPTDKLAEQIYTITLCKKTEKWALSLAISLEGLLGEEECSSLIT